MIQQIELKRITPGAEALIAYLARVSSPHQDNPEYAGLLRYCINHKHWSIFEHAHATFEIVTTRAIAAQILRHKSASFMEFSQRYAEVQGYIPCAARRQDHNNRQNSIDDLSETVKSEWLDRQKKVWICAQGHYRWAIKQGIAKECARMVLPLNTMTRLYMTGSIRSWIHYFDARCHEDAQLEHRELTLAMRERLAIELPVIAEVLEWTNT